MVFYTDWFVPKGMAGFTPGPFTLIRPAYKGDAPLHVHEAVHRRQFWRSCGLALPLMYLLSRKWRLKLEVEAYKAQIAAGMAAKSAAGFLASPAYGLGISEVEALQLLA